MFALPSARHNQIAYVTADLEAAIAMFTACYGATGFHRVEYIHEGGSPELLVALTRIGGVEVELIQPLHDATGIFRSALPDRSGPVARLHHVAIFIEGTLDDWHRHVAAIDFDRHPKLFGGDMGDSAQFIYTDERPHLGHCVEHIWMAPRLRAALDHAITAAMAGAAIGVRRASPLRSRPSQRPAGQGQG